MELPNDLVRTITLYSTFEITVTLLELSNSSQLYTRNGGVWRTKATYETLGFTLDPSVVPDWLLYYRMVTKHHFGQLIAPYPSEGIPNIQPSRVTHFVQLSSDVVVYVRDGNQLYWESESFRTSIPLPGTVRILTQRFKGEVAIVLLENGNVIEVSVFKKYNHLILLPFEPTPEPSIGNYFVVDIASVESGWLFLTRAGEFGHEYFPDWKTPTRVVRSEIIGLTPDINPDFRYSYIGRSGNPGNDAKFPVTVQYVTYGLILGIDGKIKTPSEGIWENFGHPRFTYIGLIGVSPGLAFGITTDEQLRIYDSRQPDVVSLPRYEDYFGRIVACSPGYILVTE